jgi:hypothetical protein
MGCVPESPPVLGRSYITNEEYPTMTITLDQFRASGRDCDDLGAALDDARWDLPDGGKARGRLYLDVLYIERIMHSEGEWSLLLGNDERISNDLPSLEARLYHWALSEGYC